MRCALPTHGMGSGRELNRAIAARLIIVEYERVNLWRLFATQRDSTRWHLRRELLLPGTPAGHPCRARGRDPGQGQRHGRRASIDLDRRMISPEVSD